MAEHEMRDGCGVRFKNITGDIFDINKKLDLYSENQQKTKEELIVNTSVNKMLVTTLDKIGNNMEKMQESLSNLNDGYNSLKSSQKYIEEKIGHLEIKITEKDSNGTENIANKIINNVYEDNQNKREIKIIDRKEIWALISGLIVAIGAVAIAIINRL